MGKSSRIIIMEESMKLQREVIEHDIKGKLKILSRKLIDVNGYNDTAYGIDLAIEVVDEYFNKKK